MADSDASIEILLSRITSMENTLSKIFKILNGNGSEGLVTKVALHSQKVDEIPSPTNLRWYAGVGGGITTAVGLIMWLIYYFIREAFSSG